MQRVSRKYITHMLASGIRAAKYTLGIKLTGDQLLNIADAAADGVCDLSTMVVQAETGGLEDSAGTFGVDEPWPEWVDVFELHEDFGSVPHVRLPELPQPQGTSEQALLPPPEREAPQTEYQSEEEREQARRARTCSWDLDR